MMEVDEHWLPLKKATKRVKRLHEQIIGQEYMYRFQWHMHVHVHVYNENNSQHALYMYNVHVHT